MFSNVLVPVDFTPRSERAVEVAVGVLQASGRITLLHVIELLDAPMEELEEFYAELEVKAHAKLQAFVERLREADLSPIQHVRYGKRVPEIVQFAVEGDHDLLVVGSHRMDPDHPASSWMTISHQVAILAPCPVLVVR
ncbi:MAG TPA: universal stress protein [Gemmatimonadales bacterium]|jgi:nucleotide-binding universal stress UspA family protein